MVNGFIVWRRIDTARSNRRLLVGASAFVTVSAIFLGSVFIHRLDDSIRVGVAIAGGVMLLAGLGLGFFSMVLALKDDSYVGAHVAGITLHVEGALTEFEWDEIERIDTDTSDNFVSIVAGSKTANIFIGQSAKTFAAELEQLRRRVVFGLQPTLR